MAAILLAYGRKNNERTNPIVRLLVFYTSGDLKYQFYVLNARMPFSPYYIGGELIPKFNRGDQVLLTGQKLLKRQVGVTTSENDYWSNEELYDLIMDASVQPDYFTFLYEPADETEDPVAPEKVFYYLCSVDGRDGIANAAEEFYVARFFYSGIYRTGWLFDNGTNFPRDIYGVELWEKFGQYAPHQISYDGKYVVCGTCNNDVNITSIYTEVSGTNYEIEINATTSDGDLEYSLDGINYSSDNTFTVPAPSGSVGNYTVYVRDTNGCRTITEDFNLEPIGLYGVKYRFDFDDDLNVGFRCDIAKKGYSGAVTEVTPSATPLTITRGNRTGDKFTTIRGSEAKVGLISITEAQFIDFFSARDKEWQLTVYRLDSNDVYQPFFIGFIATEDYSEVYKNAPYNVEVVFYDGLGRLKNYDYITNLEQDLKTESAIQIISKCLANTGLSIDIDTFVKIFRTNETPNAGVDVVVTSAAHIYPLESFYINTETWISGEKSMTCYQVLDEVLKLQKAKIYQEGGKWKIIDRDQSDNYWIKRYDSRGVEVDSVSNYKGSYDSSIGGVAGSQTNVVQEESLVGNYHFSGDKNTSGSGYIYYYLPIFDITYVVGKQYYVECWVKVDDVVLVNDVSIYLSPLSQTLDDNNTLYINDVSEAGWVRLYTVFTATSSTVYTVVRQYSDGGTGETFQLHVDAVSVGEYVQPNVTIDGIDRVFLSNPQMQFIPAFKEFNLDQALVKRGSIIRNGEFKILGKNKPHRNWRDDNGIGQAISLPKDTSVTPALFISGNGDDNGGVYKYSSEEFKFNATGDTTFKLSITYRGNGGPSREVRFQVIATPFYLDENGNWQNTEQFITRTIAAGDTKSYTVELNTSTLSNTASIYVNLFQATDSDGGYYVEKVSLIPSVLVERVEDKNTFSFKNNEDYIHKPEGYSMVLADTLVNTNPQILFTNNIYTSAEATDIAYKWRIGLLGNSMQIGALIGSSIFENYRVPTMELVGTIKGELSLSNTVTEGGRLFMVNSDTYNVRKAYHSVEMYEIFGNAVEDTNYELYEDGSIVYLENGDISILENG